MTPEHTSNILYPAELLQTANILFLNISVYHHFLSHVSFFEFYQVYNTFTIRLEKYCFAFQGL